MPEASDEELMRQVAAGGSEEAFRELFDRYWQRLVAYVGRMLGPAGACEDLAQDVFVRVARYRHTYEPGRAFAPWLFQIARNLVATHQRRPQAAVISAGDLDLGQVALREVVPHDEPDPSRLAQGSEARLAAAEALAGLDEMMREVVVIRLHEGWTFAEIAGRLGLTEDGARKRFLAALDRLRTELSRRGFP